LDQLGVASILKILGDFGTVGLVIFLWWTDNKRIWAVLDQYKKDMAEQREMYKSNINLVKNYETLASEHADTIRLNVAAVTELTTYLKTRTPCRELMSRQPTGRSL
jgi:hypothetical protein